MPARVLTWYQNEWMFPEKADDRRKMFQWVYKFASVVLAESLHLDNGHCGFDHGTSKSAISQIWHYVEGNAVWSDKRTMEGSATLGGNTE